MWLFFFNILICRWLHTRLSSFVSSIKEPLNSVGCARSSEIISLIWTNIVTSEIVLIWMPLRALSCTLILGLNNSKLLQTFPYGRSVHNLYNLPLFMLKQLASPTKLCFLQEAFRSVEDIHGLMSMVKKTPKPSVLVVYYAKLTEIFWISDSHLYHAYAWPKLFNLQKSYNKNLSQKDLQLIASSVLLAALSVAPYGHKYGASHLELENEKDHNLRMASIICHHLYFLHFLFMSCSGPIICVLWL